MLLNVWIPIEWMMLHVKKWNLSIFRVTVISYVISCVLWRARMTESMRDSWTWRCLARPEVKKIVERRDVQTDTTVRNLRTGQSSISVMFIFFHCTQPRSRHTKKGPVFSSTIRTMQLPDTAAAAMFTSFEFGRPARFVLHNTVIVMAFTFTE